jgi:DNA-binding transcriptional LysR family regulator
MKELEFSRMPEKPPHPLTYKDISYSLLRSYCETVRLGGMPAAARSLELSHPTVWKQIRAIERLVGQTLIESDGRRSEITEAGKLLADLAAPVVAEFEALLVRFQEEIATAPKRLSVAAPPRSFTDDLMEVIAEFREQNPNVRLLMREGFLNQGDRLLENGEVDLVIGDDKCCQQSDGLVVEEMYEIEPMVIMPLGHPLSKKRKIQPEDLARYPLLNLPEGYPDEDGRLILKNAGVFDHPDRGFALTLASTIRACVKRGHGIGLVGQVFAAARSDPELCQRSLKHFLRPIVCYGYSHRRVSENPTQRRFIDLIKERLWKRGTKS